MGCYFVFLIVALQGFLALGNAIRIGSIGTSNIFNVIDYGAVGDGLADDSQAFLKAWVELCNVVGDNTTLTAPAGKTFLLTPFLFRGPCKSSSIHIEIQGAIVAPDNLDAWKNCEGDAWMSFQFIDNLIVDGLGSINGKGLNFWHKQVSINQIQQEQSCHRPKALSFTHCNGLRLSSVTIIDSPAAHVVLTSCSDSVLSNLTITAPEDSPNTDGIDLTMSTNVQIHDSFIGTGDDCIAIGTEMSIVNISGITCGPGHGISIGSLGRDGASAKVEGIHVRHCTFNKTMCGARIKTWEGGSGYARNISYENMTLIDVYHPIVIDQHYNITNEVSAVEISDVRYSGFVGTSATLAAISLNCSETVACTNIAMESIQITSSNPAQTAVAVCQNARGTANLVVPPVPCLQRLQ